MHLPAHLVAVLVIGALIGLVSAAGIYFDSRAGGKFNVLGAATIRGVLVALLVASTVPASGGWLLAGAAGSLYGAVVGLMIVLSHGTGARHHAIYIIPPSLVSGGLIGGLIGRFWS
jgi:hypothetical protein